MALILKDRVKETSTTTGTGSLTLSGAVTGYQSFSSAIGNGNTTYYAIYLDGNTQWEVGLGTVSAGVLSRDTVLSSSNAGALVNFSAGQKTVWCDYPASKAVYANANNQIHVDGNSYIDFESAPGTTVAAGRMWYDNNQGNWNLGMGNGNITQQVGEELFVYGKASAAISGNTILQAIYQTGTVGASGTITFAPTVSGITNGDLIVGIATEDIANNGFGRVTTFGVIHGINTSGSTYSETWSDGDVIWYNPVTGGLTHTKPVAPNLKVQLGIVINAGSGGSGSFQVLIDKGSVLGGTDSNVQLTSPTNGQILTYDSADAYWRNTSLSAGTGISLSTSAIGALTVTNSAPDQTVAISAGTGISVTGTYPNFTVTNTSPSSGGTVTSVSGTAPISSTGGNTPAISISQATTSTNGYLSSTDWNTFNNKQPAGSYLTSVTADSPLTGSGTSASHLSIPAATSLVNGYLTSTDWSTFNGKQAALVSGTNIKTVNSTSLLGSGDVSVGVLTVTGTAPVVSSGGANPAISMAAATTSVNGYLTSTDWNTFNGKQAALVSGTNIKTVNGTSLLGAGDVGTIDVAHGGTGSTTLTANNVLLGNGTSALQAVAPGTSGNVLTSNGTTWTSAAASSGGISNMQVFTANGTFTIPTGIKVVKVTVIGGGGSGGAGTSTASGGGGGSSGIGISYLTGLTPANTISVTVGAAGGNSSIASGTQTITTITANGGTNGSAKVPGTGGTSTNAQINITGNSGQGGGGTATSTGVMGGNGAATTLGIGGGGGQSSANGVAGTGYGSGGGGGGSGTTTTGAAGAAGVVIFEY